MTTTTNPFAALPDSVVSSRILAYLRSDEILRFGRTRRESLLLAVSNDVWRRKTERYYPDAYKRAKATAKLCALSIGSGKSAAGARGTV